ncbi:Arginyl-tRNA--protein transferase [hydrothermal vent metagenome]|uniref:Arginyl-tRNA--protein transferase n=1 Tax=hydrothermal vent metagenome TaxID=652676 RepID=A0A3B1APB6_9ZZZZ
MTDQSKNAQDLNGLQFYVSPSHDCSYLNEQHAITLFADPTSLLNNSQYQTLSKIGFRRSGEHIYRPHCSDCTACIPVRLTVNDFKPNRNQRRILKLNSNIKVTVCNSDFSDEHYRLYQRYIKSRHPGGGMDDDDVKSYKSFITSSWSDTYLYEFRIDSKLVAIAVTDHLNDSISAVYTFFDPNYSKNSLGVYSVLWQIEYGVKNKLLWLYLGYWIKDCKKMSYKDNYRPIEYFDGTNWNTLSDK